MDDLHWQWTETVESSARHLTPAELAFRWRMSPRTLERWRSRRKGPLWLRLDGRILYRFEDVLAWERARLEQPDSDLSWPAYPSGFVDPASGGEP